MKKKTSFFTILTITFLFVLPDHYTTTEKSVNNREINLKRENHRSYKTMYMNNTDFGYGKNALKASDLKQIGKPTAIFLTDLKQHRRPTAKVITALKQIRKPKSIVFTDLKQLGKPKSIVFTYLKQLGKPTAKVITDINQVAC